MQLHVIRRFCKEKKYPLGALATTIGMSRVGLYKCIKENSISASVLEKISIALEVSPLEFFDHMVSTADDKDGYHKNETENESKAVLEVKYLREINELKDRIISQMDAELKTLKGQK